MIQQCLTTSFKLQLLEGAHDFRAITGNTFKIALYTSLATLNSSTTAYTGEYEVEADGYTAGGNTLVNVAPTSYGVTAYTSFETTSWSGNAITARGALIYNSTPVHTYTDPSVMVLDFGMDRTAVGGSFQITFPTFNFQYAIIRLGTN